MEMEELNSWMQDHAICRVEPKFGGCSLIADKFVLTSPMHPTKWYPDNLNDEDDNIDQVIRRITVIYEHTKTQPALGTIFGTTHFKNETVHIIETRRGAQRVQLGIARPKDRIYIEGPRSFDR